MNVLKCILVQKVGFLKYTGFLHGQKMKISISVLIFNTTTVAHAILSSRKDVSLLFLETGIACNELELARGDAKRRTRS